MAPPDYRRIGVDASIVQAGTVRGYDSPNIAEPAADLLITTGKNTATSVVSQIIFWNRTDDVAKPVFVFTSGSDLSTSPKVQVYSGDLTDPNTLITATRGSLYVSTNTIPSLWQCLTGSSWKRISDDLGGESLAETLAIGNVTGGNALVVTSTDSIRGEDNSLGTGGPLTLVGGASTFAGGTGGLVRIQGGSASSGATGGILGGTGTTSVSANSGGISFITGDSLLGGNAGTVALQGGRAGAPNIVGYGGPISIIGGESSTTGATPARGGSLSFFAGKAQPAGEGGSVWLWAGNAATSGVTPFVLPPVAGLGGSMFLQAGSSSSNLIGGGVSISGGTGGSSGGAGGSIFLSPGIGGGGADRGEVVASGVMRSTNLKRGDGDPNSLGTTGDEGTIFQRTSGGVGELWVNTNGTQTGWERLAFAGDFLQIFTKIQHGQITPVLDKLVPTIEGNFSDTGIFEGITSYSNFVAGFLPDVVISADQYGPTCSFQPNGTGNDVGIEISTNANGLQVQQRFLAVFKIANTSNSNSWRGVIGLSSGSIANALSSDSPAGEHIFFGKASGSNNWRVFTSGTGGPNPISLNSAAGNITASQNLPRYVVMDATDPTIQLRISILDDDFAILDDVIITDPTLFPQSATNLYPVIGIRQTAGTFARLTFWVANVIVEADKLLLAAAATTPIPTLEQVLLSGNTTGITPIEISEGALIRAETDGGGGSGSNLALISGATLVAGNSTGIILLSSASHGVAAGTGSTGSILIQTGSQLGAGSSGVSGDLVLSSGNISALSTGGDSGDVTITSGENGGAGSSTGSIRIRTGEHSGGGAVGSILLQPGGPVDISATPGNITFAPAKTTINGVPGGSIQGTSGASGSIGDTGAISFTTNNADVQGDAGIISLTGGQGGSADGRGGTIALTGGDGIGAGALSLGGSLVFSAGDGIQAGGSVSIVAGDSTALQGANVTIQAGDQLAAGLGGNIFLIPGTGSTDGQVIVQGKLTVTGLIDPTGLVLDGQVSSPYAPPVGQGVLWIDQGDDSLNYTNSGGTVVLGSGGATTLASLTDVAIAGPVLGEVLTFNGLKWQNLPGIGGSPLSTILALGNTTGAFDIEVNTGQDIHGQTDLLLNPGPNPLDQVVIDSLRWPLTDGSPGDVLTTDGAGNLSFAPGGGGSSGSFAAAFAQMQWGMIVPPTDGSGDLNGTGLLFTHNDTSPGAASTSTNDSNGQFTTEVCVAGAAEAGYITTTSPTRIDAKSFYLLKFKVSGVTNVRVFVGFTTGTRFDMATSDAPGSAAGGYLGFGFSTVLAETEFQWIHNTGAGLGTRTTSGITATTDVFHVTLDATVPGQVTGTVYDEDFVTLNATVINANLPTGTTDLNLVTVLYSTAGPNLAVSTYQAVLINRADLLAGVGGGGTQNLAQVLLQGNEVGGTPIQGDDNPLGNGGTVQIKGGASTGAGGSGGGARISGGVPDPGGNGDGGTIRLDAAAGVGIGMGGGITFQSGDGGSGGGDAGSLFMLAGTGAVAGVGGSITFQTGDGGGGGGSPGAFDIILGAAVAGNVPGASGSFTASAGVGTGTGGSWVLSAGDGGATGDGGSITISPGLGNGGGADGVVSVTGDLLVSGKLTVVGMIDPPGLLMSSSLAAPATPVGTEGLLWISSIGDLIYTTFGGSINISQGISGSVGFLDALLIAGYGFLSPGNAISYPQADGVLGGSTYNSTVAGATITFSGDIDGPVLSLSTAAAPTSEATIGTGNLAIRRDQRFKATFKFQVTSPVHTDERLFVGFTSDASTQLSADDPPALFYMGLEETLAGTNLNFVSRGPVSSTSNLAVPTDGFVHFFVVDCTSTSEVVFKVVASDGVTIQATYTETDANVLPALTQGLQLMAGVKTVAGAVRDMDFYSGAVVTRADIVDAVAGGGGTPPSQGLPSVLTIDNQTAGIPIKGSDDVTGGALELLGGDSTGGGGNGGLVRIQSGIPDAGGTSGTVTISSANGDTAGIISISPGISAVSSGTNLRLGGGDATAVGQVGGNVTIFGGASTLSQGGNVSITSGLSFAGSGGSVQVQGSGGTSNGNGGIITLTGGNGAGTGAGGNIALNAGAHGGGGTVSGGISFTIGGSTLPAAIDGNIQGAAGAHANASGASFVFAPGSSTLGGQATLSGGTALAGVTGGGHVLLTGGAESTGGGDGSVFLLGPGISIPGAFYGGILISAKAHASGGAGGFASFTESTSGFGGAVNIEGGDAGGGTGAQGGSVSISGGNSDGAVTGGGITLTGGTSPTTGGPISLVGGDSSGASQNGGQVLVRGGSGISTSYGGNATLAGGNIGSTSAISFPNTAGRGGHVFVIAGASDGSASGANVYVYAGQSGSTATSGGAISIAGGPGRSGSTAGGGSVSMIAGGGGSAGGQGGSLSISAGDGFAGGFGGSTSIVAGNGGGGGVGGDLTLGSGTGATTGVIYLQGKIATAGTALQHGKYTIVAGGLGPFSISFPIAFASSSLNIQISLESSVGATALRIAGGSITTAGFQVRPAAGLSLGDIIHWTAMQL